MHVINLGQIVASAAPTSGAHVASQVPTQMMGLGLLILAAHMGGKLFRRLHLSDLTGQLLGGALVGPYALHVAHVLPQGAHPYDNALGGFHFFVFVFLSMVAFGIGEELHTSRLKQVGRSALGIVLMQGLTTWGFISAGFYFLADFKVLDALLIGSIGIASAPAVIFVLMNQLRIEGRLRRILASVVVLADLVEIIIFAILVQISLKGSFGPNVALTVAGEVLLAALVGGAVYLVLRVLVRRQASLPESHEPSAEFADGASFLQRMMSEHPSPSAEILLIVMGAVSMGAGFAYYMEWPFLITVMVAGFLVANLHTHAIFDSLKIENITPVFSLGFFALIGANISLDGFGGKTAWMSVLYIVTRLVGKLWGTWLGCKFAGEDPKITACLPKLLLPQAGVGAVEAVYASAVLGDPRFAAIILPAIVFFEVAGVPLVDRSLRRWRTWVTDEGVAMRGGGPSEISRVGTRHLSAYLTPDFICMDLQAQTKNDVLAEMLDRARASSRQHIDRSQALQVIGEREQLSPTGLGHGVAVPHCRLIGIEQPVLVFGRHNKGVVFGGIDDMPCHLIMMILSSASDPGEHLRLLAATAHLFTDAAMRERLRAADGAYEVMDIISASATTATSGQQRANGS